MELQLQPDMPFQNISPNSESQSVVQSKGTVLQDAAKIACQWLCLNVTRTCRFRLLVTKLWGKNSGRQLCQCTQALPLPG